MRVAATTVLVMGALVVADVHTAWALETTPSIVVYVQGEVKAIKASGQSVVLALGSEVAENDTIETGPNSQVRLRLFDRSLLRFGENSRAQMSSLRYDGAAEKKNVSVKLLVGRLWASVSKLLSSDSKFEVDSGNAVAGVRGTEFAVLLQGGGGGKMQAIITTVEGSVSVRGADGSERIVAGGFRAISDGGRVGEATRVSAEQLSALRDESRGNNPSGGADAERTTRDEGDRAVQARVDSAAQGARERIAALGGRDGRDGRDNTGRERDNQPRVTGGQDVIETRQRARDVFQQFNERAAATRLRAIIEVRD